MTVEDLLKPRIKVTAKYPFSPYEIGDIVEESTRGTSYLLTVTKEWSEWEVDHVPVHNFVPLSEIDSYPALFKEVFWWEDRKPEDMPQYLKRVNDDYAEDCVNEITWKEDEGTIFGNQILFNMGVKYPLGWLNIKYFNDTLPATEQEYNEYTQSLHPSPPIAGGE